MLPVVTNSRQFYCAQKLPLQSWAPALEKIARLHKLGTAKIARFALGEMPMFSFGRLYVIKLVPGIVHYVAMREAAALRVLNGSSDVPIATLRAAGKIDGWRYVVQRRLSGVALPTVWPSLSKKQRLEMATAAGRIIHQLHQVPLDEFATKHRAQRKWNSFVSTAANNWKERWRGRLPQKLIVDGARFLRRAGFFDYNFPQAAVRFLHGDLAPENVLVRQRLNRWHISGIVDFGNAIVGDPLFDYTAPTVLFAPGDLRIVTAVLVGGNVLAQSSLIDAHTRERLMAYTLIHPVADLPACLGLIPEGSRRRSWKHIAEFFWPEWQRK